MGEGTRGGKRRGRGGRDRLKGMDVWWGEGMMGEGQVERDGRVVGRGDDGGEGMMKGEG